MTSFFEVPYRSTTSPVIEFTGPAAVDITRHTSGAAGFDIAANESVILGAHTTVKIATGISLRIPDGYEIQARPRSGLSAKGLFVTFGTIDSDYRGEIMVIVHNSTPRFVEILQGDRIAQLVVAPVLQVTFKRVESIEIDTVRGTKGFGSTDA